MMWASEFLQTEDVDFRWGTKWLRWLPTMCLLLQLAEKFLWVATIQQKFSGDCCGAVIWPWRVRLLRLQYRPKNRQQQAATWNTICFISKRLSNGAKQSTFPIMHSTPTFTKFQHAKHSHSHQCYLLKVGPANERVQFCHLSERREYLTKKKK